MIKKITNSVTCLCTQNPDLKIFDIIMRTDYGTTYNSFVVKGSQKTALIDTTHEDFEGEFFKELESVTPIEKIDYLVVNHCEPDHTGSLRDLILKNPNIEIFCTSVSGNFLKNITNLTTLKIHPIKDGETLGLGDKTLKFIVAPFLHWPDSMFAFLVEEKIAFTCDFFGTHFCDKEIMDTDIKNMDAYKKEFKNYYECIFAPFESFARIGLEKINALSPEIIAPSHGPILTKNGQLDSALKSYAAWTQPKAALDYIPIFYCSAYGNTEKLAEAIASGLNQKYKLFNVIEHNLSDLQSIMNQATVFAVGTPTINKNGLPPIINILSGLDCINSRSKSALVFGSFGWSGEARGIITKFLESMGVKCFEHDLKVLFVPSEQDLEKAKNIGSEFGKLFQQK